MTVKSKGYPVTAAYERILEASTGRFMTEIVNKGTVPVLVVIGAGSDAPLDVDAFPIPVGASWSSPGVAIGGSLDMRGDGGTGEVVIITGGQ